MDLVDPCRGEGCTGVPLGCSWFLTGACNYACPYCFDQAKPSEHPEIRMADVERVFGALVRQRGPMECYLSGGEPTLHPLFEPILQFLTSLGNVVLVNTNLSRGAAPFLRSAGARPCAINASFHPSSAAMASFGPAVRELVEAGFHVEPTIVTYPPNEPHIDGYARELARYVPDVPLVPLAFLGTYRGRAYAPPEPRPPRAEAIGGGRGPGLQRRGERLCRAGCDFFAIQWTGTIVRCVSHVALVGGRWPNLLLADGPLPCPLDRCYCNSMHHLWAWSPARPRGDTMASSDGENACMAAPAGPAGVLEAVDRRIGATLCRPDVRARFSWYVGVNCNFRCPYCVGPWRAAPGLRLPVQEAINGWRRWHEERGVAQICCTGAEPMFDREGAALLGEISRWHVLDINSNMSFRIEHLDLFQLRENVYFTTSYHPMTGGGRSQPLSEFLQKIADVRERGFRVNAASCVAYPPAISALADVKREVEGEGLGFVVHLYRGEYQGRRYPAGYTDAERDMLTELFGGRAALDAAGAKTRRGQPCWAGSKYFLIHADGTSYRCPDVPTPLPGSLYDGTLSPAAVPQPCPLEAGCHCQELWVYHASEDEAEAARAVAACATAR